MGNACRNIIDLSGATLPIANEDKSLWIVFNGEIFNYVELCEGLVARGHRFCTYSDTEVVLHLFEEFGPECLDQLNGQFSVATWDARQRRLFFERHRPGLLPLFHTQLADGTTEISFRLSDDRA
jgi:asparagine synthase (glutamine-hydrolysing)